jgi:hypothetical protein
MRVEFLKTKGTWRDIADSARTTIGLEPGNKEISSQWKRKMLMCEHSPIRQLIIKWKWIDLKSWVSVHLVRHWLGITHFVRTQRTDRTGVDRDKLPQDNPVIHEAEANAQAIINISRKRLCSSASLETRQAWREFLDSFKDEEPELYRCCVKECVYRGFCPEFKSCGYHKTSMYQLELKNYREGINE